MKTRFHYRFIAFASFSIILIVGLMGFTILQQKSAPIIETSTIDNGVIKHFCRNGIENHPFFDSLPHVNLDKGKILFRNNCASCHNKNMKMDMTGPALSGVLNRWSSYPKEDLYRYIRSAQAMADQNHPKALELEELWGATMMPDYSNFTDEDIENILAYIEAI